MKIRYLPCLLILLVLGACDPVAGPAPLPPIGQAEAYYASGDYSSASDVFARHAALEGAGRYKSMYYLGMCQMKLGQWDKAKATFDNVIRFSNNRSLQARSLAVKGDMALQKARAAEGERIFKDLYKNYYDVFPKDESLAGMIRARRLAGDLAGANKLRLELVEKYPTSKFLEDSPRAPLETTILLYRVRLEQIFKSKAAALEEMRKLSHAGIENAIFRIKGPTGALSDVFQVQIGAFSNPNSARKRAEVALRHGWKTVVSN